MKCKAYTNWTVAFIHAQSGTMGVNSTMYLITIHLITNVSAVTVNCDGVGVCVCSNREKSHTRFEMYFQMHRKLNWLMAKWMRLNGFRWAFLHTVKRLMMALVSFCKRIQCVNEIELVNKHRIYLSHHTTPEIHLACLFRFCSRFCTRRSVEFRQAFWNHCQCHLQCLIAVNGIEYFSELAAQLNLISLNLPPLFTKISINFLQFNSFSLEFVRVVMVFFIEITTNNWFISDIKLNLVL